MKEKLIYKEESYKILGACFEVYKERGCGLLEAVYQECLEIEMDLRNIPFSSQAALNCTIKTGNLSKRMFLILNVMGKSLLSLNLLKI